MAMMATEATAASTATSMITMNLAARFAASGEGWVIPMVLMKAFAMRRRNFIVIRCGVSNHRSKNRAWLSLVRRMVHLIVMALPEWWRGHTLKGVG
jgi:hypothetical protein